VPYRIELSHAAADAFDWLVDLGVLDIELTPAGGVIAVVPDAITAPQVGEK
jgi:hypothetical protein